MFLSSPLGGNTSWGTLTCEAEAWVGILDRVGEFSLSPPETPPWRLQCLMPLLAANFIGSGVYAGGLYHAFLCTDLKDLGTVADTHVLHTSSAGSRTTHHASINAEAALLDSRFAVIPRPSKRLPPSGVLLLVEDGRISAYESAPLVIVQRSVACVAVQSLELSLDDERMFALHLAVHCPITESRRAAMKAFQVLTKQHGDSVGVAATAGSDSSASLSEVCFALVPSLLSDQLAFLCAPIDGIVASRSAEEEQHSSRPSIPSRNVLRVRLAPLPTSVGEVGGPQSPPRAVGDVSVFDSQRRLDRVAFPAQEVHNDVRLQPPRTRPFSIPDAPGQVPVQSTETVQ